MINFKDETLNTLQQNLLTVKDIKWIGCEDGYIDIDEFMELADFEYDNGWCMKREEYDGSEWWKVVFYNELINTNRKLDVHRYRKGRRK